MNKMAVVGIELPVSVMNSKSYGGITYWCSPDGLC